MKYARSLWQRAVRFVLVVAGCVFCTAGDGGEAAEEADVERDPFAFDLEETVAEEPPPTPVEAAAKTVGNIRIGDVTIELTRDEQGDTGWLRREGMSAPQPPRAEITDPQHPISLAFQNIDIKTALGVMADIAGENIVFGESVQGTLSLHLRDVPWQRAFEIVLLGGGLGVRREGNIAVIAPASEIAGHEAALLRGQAEVDELAPLVTELVQIQHTEATALHALVSGADGRSRALSERGSASVDERTNTLILIDTRERLDALRNIVGSIDVPVRQVLIEARIVNVNKRKSEQLGVLWRLSNKGGAANAESSTQTPDAANAAGSDTSIGFQLGLAATGESARFGIGFIDGGKQVDLELSALESRGAVEIVARPKVITADQHRATVESGVEIPYQQAASSGATATAFKEAVLQLEVTPRITPGDWVSLDLEVKQDTIGAVFGGVPSVNTTKIITRVLVDNGATVVLGGIAQTDSNTSISKTPLLGDIPGIGWLFRRRVSRDDEQELLVFITPSILERK